MYPHQAMTICVLCDYGRLWLEAPVSPALSTEAVSPYIQTMTVSNNSWAPDILVTRLQSYWKEHIPIREVHKHLLCYRRSPQDFAHPCESVIDKIIEAKSF